MRLLFVSTAVVTLGFVACGGPPAAVGPAPAATPSGKAETFAEVHPDDLAALGGGTDAGSVPSTDLPPSPGASAPGSSGSVAKGNDPPDECTPIGVEWEKTARPKLKECYAQGKKKDPNLQGTVKISVDISITGKIKSTKIVEKTLPDPVADCMLKAVKATPIPDQDKCRGKSLTIPVTFPTPK